MAPSALPTDTDPTHHATLEDRNGVKVGIMLTDPRGGQNVHAIRRTPIRREGIKISQGESTYGGLLPPFSEVDQDDWSGGMGLLQLDDRRRYYSGEMADTSYAKRVILGPEPCYVAGVRMEVRQAAGNQEVDYPNPLFGRFKPKKFRGLYGEQAYIEHEFVPNETVSATEIYLLVRRVGIPKGLHRLYVALMSGAAGSGGSVLKSGSLHYSDDAIPIGRSVLRKVTFASETLTAATTYHVRFYADVNDDASNHFEIGVMGPVIFDDFTGEDGIFITSRKPPVRYTNEPAFGSAAPTWFPGAGNWSLQSGKLLNSTAGASNQYATINTNLSDSGVKCTMKRNAGRVGLVIKFTSSSDWVYAYADGTDVVLVKVNAGVPSTVATASFSWLAGATKTMEIRSDSTILIQVLIDGVQVISANPTPCANGFESGVYGYGSTSPNWNEYDDFQATRLENGTYRSADGSSWFLGPEAPAYRIAETATPFRAFPFEYKGGFYVVLDYESGATPKLYINGDRGVATGAQTSTTLKDTTKAWTTNEFAQGAIVKIWAGTGREQWRRVSSNTADTLSVSPAWDITPVAASTEYVIVRSDRMREITGHGLTGPITDVLSSSVEVVYFAQGEAVNIRRMRERVNAGAWVREYADDGTNKVRFLRQYMDSKLGGRIAGAVNPDNGGSYAKHGKVPSWGTDISFGGQITTGRDTVRITGLENYGSPDQLWILCQGEVGRVSDDKYNPIPLREFASVASELNGFAHIVHDLYLYFSLGRGGMQRFYQDNLDDIGPNRDDGLLAALRGPFAAYAGYPGLIFGATGRPTFDWPSDHRATIFKYNGAWHPWYVHPENGIPIRSLYVQVIPGDAPDRLWFNAGGDLLYVTLPSDMFDPLQDENVVYYHQATLRLSWNAYNFKDRVKFFDKMKVFAENLYAGLRSIGGYYDVDDGTGQHLLSGTATGSVSSLTIVSADNHQTGKVVGKRIQVELVIESATQLITPILRAIVHSGVVFLDTKYRIDMTYRLKDDDTDLNGDPDPYPTAEGKATQLEQWANSGELLTFRSIFSPYDNHVVSIDAESLSPYLAVPDEQLEGHIAQVGLIELR